MRGDSIRDLYAKTLALLGLGVLAGTGALVDYWPAGVRLPVVESGLPQAEVSLALAVPDQPFEPVVQVASAPARLHLPPVVSPAVSLAAFIPNPAPLESEPVADQGIQAVALTHPAVLVPQSFAHQDSSATLGAEVSLSEPPTYWTDAPLTMSSAPVALSAAEDPGVIADVVRATKSSLVVTGRKTGASIVGAFRAVSGAVKKALPNRDLKRPLIQDERS